ncbi:hypothetical protein CHL78_006055 [Romboutsia weinsteinii]|uniref:M50 family peptidase n=1 Tax=Romboutsia weinsteinii TaxID=2020949 RepID=A0A371J5Y1_9FIRM|nr:hypothetical protein [Romboutsia weinsteinii]RDY28155.1 hypothetical protein CHL78_006055 [Romboutsia weinsteinii]
MDFIVYLLVYILFTPILTMIHELGHAIPALIFTKGDVSVNIGNSNLKKQIKLNRLVINIYGYRSIIDVSYGYINWKPIDSKLKSIIMIAGGPIASLFTSGLLYFSLYKIELSYLMIIVFNAMLLFSLGQFIVTILPMKYGDNSPYKGFTSDGYKIVQWLKLKNTN